MVFAEHLGQLPIERFLQTSGIKRGISLGTLPPRAESPCCSARRTDPWAGLLCRVPLEAGPKRGGQRLRRPGLVVAGPSSPLRVHQPLAACPPLGRAVGSGCTAAYRPVARSRDLGRAGGGGPSGARWGRRQDLAGGPAARRQADRRR